jgi:hypothetical protein
MPNQIIKHKCRRIYKTKRAAMAPSARPPKLPADILAPAPVKGVIGLDVAEAEGAQLVPKDVPNSMLAYFL